MNQPVPADDRYSSFTAWGVVLLVLAHLCWMQLRPESKLRQICAMTMGPGTHVAMPERNSIDRIVQATGKDNLLLTFAWDAETNPIVKSDPSSIYYQTCYALYPRRVYVAPADKIINNGLDILQAKFHPSLQWLQERDVRFVLTFGTNALGQPRLHFESLTPWDTGGQ
ncbi:MAG: hypothetical protein ABSA83_04020 [Verrucomicrobiota bacterium]